jgi:hypothetical protein
MTFGDPGSESLDLSRVEYGLNFCSGLLHRALQICVDLLPGRVHICLAGREDLPHPRILVIREAQLSAKLSKHLIMMSGDVWLRGMRSRVRRSVKKSSVCATTDNESYHEGRGDCEECTGRLVQAYHWMRSEVGVDSSVAIVGALADVASRVASGSVGEKP